MKATSVKSGSVGLYFSIESCLPSFDALFNLTRLESRESRWYALSQLLFFSDCPPPAKSPRDEEQHILISYLAAKKHELEQRIQSTLLPGTFLYDLTWFEMNMPTIRKVARQGLEHFETSEDFLLALEGSVDSLEYARNELTTFWQALKQAEGLFSVEVLFDKIQLGRFKSSLSRSTTFIRGYILLLLEHYNILTLARLQHLGISKNSWDNYLFSLEDVALPLDEAGDFSISLLFEAKKELFDRFSLIPREVVDIEKAFLLEEISYVNQALIFPDEEAVALQCIKKITSLFYDVHVALFTDGTDGGELLVDYTLL